MVSNHKWSVPGYKVCYLYSFLSFRQLLTFNRKNLAICLCYKINPVLPWDVYICIDLEGQAEFPWRFIKAFVQARITYTSTFRAPSSAIPYYNPYSFSGDFGMSSHY